MRVRRIVDWVHTSIAAKVCFFIILTETLLLSVLGLLFLRSYTRELEQALAEKMALPATLMAQMALNFEAATDLQALRQLVQEPVVEAFVARREGLIFYASDAAAVGRPYADVIGPEASRLASAAASGRPGLLRSEVGGRRYFSVLAPLAAGRELIGFLYLKVDGQGVVAKERFMSLWFALGSATTIVLTNLIASFWMNRLLVPRIARTVAALQEVKEGQYATRLSGTGAPDQIGNLMRSVNAMIEQVDAHTANLRTLAQCGEELANAASRGDVQEALTRAVGARFSAAPGGACRVEPEAEAAPAACAGLSPAQAAALAAGEILLVGGTSSARVLLPAVGAARSGETIWFEVDPGPEGLVQTTEIFLRMLGRLLAEALQRIDAMAIRYRAEQAESQRNAAEAANRAKSEMLAMLEEKNQQLQTTLEELRLAQTKLVQSEKMAAMGTMAAGVAHDLNNILSGIVSYPDLLLLQVPAESPLRESLLVIRESGTRAAAVVADLLTIARGAAYQTERCNLNRLIERFLQTPECRQLRRRFPAVRVETRLSGDLRGVRCSGTHMEKVVMNLVMNACEAIGGEGSVLLSTENLAVAAGGESSRAVPPGEYVALKVADTGPGIPEQDLAHVFEPFFSKKVLGRSGTGLGLTVVWNTVHEHRGAVVAESGASGAVFTVLLPACDAGAPCESPAESAPGGLRGSGTVLVVDDESQLRHIATRILAALGYRAEGVASGEEAIACLREHPVDLVLLDMLMPPGMNGCEAYREMVRIRPGQRAVICSGYALSDDCEEARRAGAGGFLRKPYTLEELGLAVKRELERPA